MERLTELFTIICVLFHPRVNSRDCAIQEMICFKFVFMTLRSSEDSAPETYLRDRPRTGNPSCAAPAVVKGR